MTVHALNLVITSVIFLYVARFCVVVGCCASCRKIDHESKMKYRNG